MSNEKKLLNPCSPCVCTGAPCEQCIFGYRTNEENHKIMKELLLAVESGEKPSGWKCAETYKAYHRDWKDRLSEESAEEKPVTYSSKVAFQVDVMSIIGIISKAQAKEIIEILWNKYFKEEK